MGSRIIPILGGFVKLMVGPPSDVNDQMAVFYLEDKYEMPKM
jgi:hypothetical protein